MTRRPPPGVDQGRRKGAERVIIEELRRLREAGTPGPWGRGWQATRWVFTSAPGAEPGSQLSFGPMISDADAALIVAAVNNLDALLDIATAARDYSGWDVRQTPPEGAEALCAALDRLFGPSA